MKLNRMIPHLMLLLPAAGLSSAFAGTVVINGHQCVDASVPDVIAKVTSYALLHSSKDADYKPAGMSLMHMMTSAKIGGTVDDALVFFKLVPLDFGNEKRALFPRFSIRCRVTRSGDNSAQHDCRWATPGDFAEMGRTYNPEEVFGLSDFSSHLTVTGGACDEGKTDINFTVTLDPSDSDVEQIKDASLLAKFPEYIQRKFFNKEDFMKDYFENFYNGWLKQIGQ